LSTCDAVELLLDFKLVASRDLSRPDELGRLSFCPLTAFDFDIASELMYIEKQSKRIVLVSDDV
jgi:hypothetical protein